MFLTRLDALSPASSPTNALPKTVSHKRLLLVFLFILGVLCLAFTSSSEAASSSTFTPTEVRSIDATTGTKNAASIVAQPVCSKPTASHAACMASILVSKSTHHAIHPNLRRPGFHDSPYRVVTHAIGVHPAVNSATPPALGTPAYLQQAYDLTGLSAIAGSSDTVAIVDAYSDNVAASDLATYRSQYGLPACTTANGCFKEVNQQGNTSPLPANNQGWSVEISLDLDSVSALCPNCKILLVDATSNGMPDLEAAEATAYSLGANQISNSWGEESPGNEASSGISESMFSFPNASTLVASGDNGYYGTKLNDYPASLAGVTSVGGTTLSTVAVGGTSNPRGYDETVWGNPRNGTNSGCNTTVTQPTWQKGLACAGRAFNDISADADPGTGLLEYDSQVGGWIAVGGTSLATPLTAAYYALLGGVSNQNAQWSYTNSSFLNDIISGNNSGPNGSCTTFICVAGHGFDGPTGNGSISGTIAAGPPGVAAPSQTNNSYVAGQTATSVILAGGVYPNQLDTQYYWQYGTSTSYGSSTPVTDIGNGTTAPARQGGLVPVTTTLTGLQSGTTYHYRLVAQNNYGNTTTTTYGYDYTFTYTETAKGSVPPTVSATATSITQNSTTLLGSINPSGSATTYFFEYGTTLPYSNTSTPVVIPAGNSTFNVSLPLSGLQPNATYHYSLVASNAAGEQVVTADKTFKLTSTPPPSISGVTASVVTGTTATLKATINPAGLSTTYYFEYGTTSSYGSTSTGATTTASVTASPTITGLQPNTTYHYTVVATDSAGQTTYTDQTFTTLPPPPSVSSAAVSNITSTGASFTGTLTNNSTESTTYFFEYGTTSSYGLSTASAVTTANVTPNVTVSGLLPNTTYHFTLLAKNASGQVVTSDQTFTTLPPAPAVTSVSATSIATTSVTLKATVTPGTLSTTYYFEYGTTTSYGTAEATSTITTTTAATQAITGLQPGTTYHYAVVATNSSGKTTSADQSFTTLPALPSVSNAAATNITTTGATFGGTVTLNSAGTTSYYFEYGTTSSYGSATTSVNTSPSATPSITVTGLQPGTTYHYALLAKNASGQVVTTDQTFTTASPAPALSAISASSITTTGVTLKASVNPYNISTTYYFEYGTTSAYGTAEATSTITSTTAATQAITGLQPNTTYHYAVVATNATGKTTSTDLTFTTLPIPPSVSSVESASVTAATAVLSGTVTLNSPVSTTYYFEYGTTTSYGSVTSSVVITADASPSLTLTGLKAGTTYHYALVAKNAGGQSVSSDQTFTTLPPAPALSSVSATSLTATGVTLKGTITPGTLSTTYYFEYGTTNAYGTTTSEFVTTATFSASQVITGLQPSTTYHYALVATNATGTTTYSDQTFTTLPNLPSVSASAASSSATSAIFKGTITLNSPGSTTYYFEYGTTASYGSKTAVYTITSTSSPSLTVSGLKAGTTYHYALVATNAGGQVVTTDQTFTTPAAPGFVLEDTSGPLSKATIMA